MVEFITKDGQECRVEIFLTDLQEKIVKFVNKKWKIFVIILSHYLFELENKQNLKNPQLERVPIKENE